MVRWIAVLMAVDEGYATPLRVAVQSLVDHIGHGTGVDLHLMASGLTPRTRREIESCFDQRIRLHWTPVGSERFGHAPSPAANFRLLAGSSLPGVSKVIYLDADVLVRGDVSEIWERDMAGNIVLAVQDSYIQRDSYFNSGVMVIDLEAWRAEGIEQRLIDAAARLPRSVKWLDQDLLNICLAGRWGALPPKWNKQFALDLFPDWWCSPYREEEFVEARREPAIVHFCTPTKPWHAFCDHPAAEVAAYRKLLGAAPVPLRIERLAEFFLGPHRRLLIRAGAVFRARRRAYTLWRMLPSMLAIALLRPWTLVSVPLAGATLLIGSHER